MFSVVSIWGSQCDDHLTRTWRQLFAADGSNPTPSDLAERWRFTTVEQLIKMSGTKVITEGYANGEARGFKEGVLQARNSTESDILIPLQTVMPSLKSDQVSVIIDRAFSLALKMVVRRCRVDITIPQIGEQYVSGETSHLRSVLDNEEEEEGTVAFIIKPGLAKWGDAQGKKLEQRLDIVSAEVFIDPPQEILVQMPQKENFVEDPDHTQDLIGLTLGDFRR